MENIACAIVFCCITWMVEKTPDGAFDDSLGVAIMVLLMWFGSFLGAVL